VGTATGAEVQSVLKRTTQTYRKPDHNVQSAAALRIGRSAVSQGRDLRRRYDPQRAVTGDRAHIFRRVRGVKELVRAGHRIKHGDHLVRGDDDLAELIVSHSSLAVCGLTWPAETLLARILNKSDRNIWKRVARVRVANLLIVIPPREGRRSDRYVPVFDAGPLFEVALTSELRDAIAALCLDGDGTGTLEPHQNTAEAEATAPTADMVAPLIVVAASAEHGVAP
jgi:hypothetical protein